MTQRILKQRHLPEQQALENEGPLNLDALSFDELGRAPVSQETSKENPAPRVVEVEVVMVEWRPHRRCATHDRELSRNDFPIE